MWNEFFPTRKMRAELRAKLPPRAFLQLDRGDALFITNAPLFSQDVPEAAGFSVQRRGRNLCYTPDESWLIRLERRARAPMDELSATLARFRGKPIEKDMPALYARALKIAEGDIRSKARDVEAFERDLRRRSALALREGGGGGLYALSIVNARLKAAAQAAKEAEK